MEEVTLDVLPLKRVLAIEESGTEFYPPEPSIEEKPLSLLRCLDFDRNAEKKKEAKKSRKDGPQAWPWQALVEHFHQAREELVTLQDFISNIEANETLAVQHMMKPKLLPNEICADLALRFSSKSRNYKDVGKYLKRSAKAMERQAERESVFYEALMRLQCNWKIKRQRVVAAGPGSKAGFIIDLAFPQSLDSNLINSPRTARSIEIKVDQDANGFLTVQLPPGKSVSSLQLQLLEGASNNQTPTPWQQHEPQHQKNHEKQPGALSDEAAASANLMLRRLQTSNIDELVFECLCRESLQPSTSTSLIGIGDATLQVSVGESLAVMFRLFKDSEQKPNEEALGKLSLSSSREEESSRICIKQAFHSMLRLPHSKSPAGAKPPAGAITTNESGSLLKQFSVLVRHRLASSRITSLLDKLVLEVPQLWFLSHPSWKPFVSAWDVCFDVPGAITRGGQLKHQDWSSLNRPNSRVSFQCTLVLRQESLRVEGLDGCMPLPKHSGQESTEMTSYSCSISGLALFLLTQIAGKILKWLEEEAALLGTRVRRNFLSIIFEIENSGHISLVASPGGFCINWWLRFYSTSSSSSSSSGLEEAPVAPVAAAASLKEKWIESTTPTSEKFLGPLGLEALRATLMDLLSLIKEAE